MEIAACITLALATTASAQGLARPASAPEQVPLCMIGDSITWAGEGDWWRRYLLENLPRLAFVGTHSAVLGYAHAGEGGNGTGRVLQRMGAIPDCPYYALEIGTNDNSINDEARVRDHARGTADRIAAIVNGLLAKPSVRKVFLGSVLPCFTDNPLRDKTNSATNTFLRERMGTEFPSDRVVWVEYERPLRDIDDWESMILLHPTKDGYRLIARYLSDAIIHSLQIEDPAAKPVPMPGAGVQVTNLWSAPTGRTAAPVIAGWYTLSCDVAAVEGDKGSLTVRSVADNIAQPIALQFEVPAERAGARLQFEVFTGYEGYGYTRDYLRIETEGCRIERVMFEKKRPGAAASVYGEGVFVDTGTPPAPGELLTWPADPGADE